MVIFVHIDIIFFPCFLSVRHYRMAIEPMVGWFVSWRMPSGWLALGPNGPRDQPPIRHSSGDEPPHHGLNCLVELHDFSAMNNNYWCNVKLNFIFWRQLSACLPACLSMCVYAYTRMHVWMSHSLSYLLILCSRSLKTLFLVELFMITALSAMP